MCGVIAALKPVDVKEGLKKLLHRGIRARVVEKRCGSVGHVRLPIVGLGPRWDQPCNGRTQTIGFVGEILDFREDPKYADAECDLTALVDAWERGPERGFQKTDGFWSVVVLDEADEVIYALCDYLGQKPLYYRTDCGLVASELDAVLETGQHRVTPDEVYFASVVKWGYCPEVWRTPYLEVRRVRPGELVTLNRRGLVRRQPVDPLEPIPMTPMELKGELEAAIRRRVTSSDVPVAILVSGGLDSSIVYTVAKRYGTLVPYYARDEEDPDADEALAVSAIAPDAKEISWNRVNPNHAMAIMQEPIDLGSLVPQVALSNQVKERVCLTGDGADEFFGGYSRSMRYDSQASDVWHELVAWHLPRLDRVMMRNQIEVRSPFLARRVAAGALSQPWTMRKDKVLLRELYRHEMPPTVADRPKKPLRTPRVEKLREQNSIEMVEKFRREKWPR